MEQEFQCLECGAELYVEAFVETGDVIVCDTCGMEYMVRHIDPVRISSLAEEY